VLVLCEQHEVLGILDNSRRELGALKANVEPLVGFFRSIVGDIDHTVDQSVESFLRPVVAGIREGTTPDEVEAINISRRSKEVR